MLCVEQLKYIIVLYTSYHNNNICRSTDRRQPSVCTGQETPLVRFNFWWKYLWESLKTFKNFPVLIEHRAFVTHKKKFLARLGNIYLGHANLKIQLRNKKRVACDYRVITVWEMRVKHEAIAECFSRISSAVITR